MAADLKSALREGLADALGLVIGGLAGRYAGLAFGYDFFQGTGWDSTQIIGLVFILAGTGAGRILFRHFLVKKKP